MNDNQLIAALNNKPTDIIDALREKTIDPSVTVAGTPLLSLAIEYARLDVANSLLEHGADVSQYATSGINRGKAPIHFAKSPDAIQLLQEFKADVNARYKYVDRDNGLRNETLLHTAALEANLELADSLLAAGAIDHVSFGNVPAESSIKRPNGTLKKMLDELRAKQIVNTITPMPVAIQSDGTNSISALRNKAAASDLSTTNAQPDQLLNGRLKKNAAGEYVHEANSARKIVEIDDKLVVHSSVKGIDEHSADLIKASVLLAKQKNWEGIVVNGTEDFRRESWLAAKIEGLNVVGYEPTEMDLRKLRPYQETQRQVFQPVDNARDSLARREAEEYVLKRNGAVRAVNTADDVAVGRIQFANEKFLVQETGRNLYVIHDKSQISGAAITADKSVKIHYSKGQGRAELQDSTKTRFFGR